MRWHLADKCLAPVTLEQLYTLQSISMLSSYQAELEDTHECRQIRQASNGHADTAYLLWIPPAT